MQRVFRTAEKCEERQVTTLSTLMTFVMMALLLLSLTLVFVSVARADIADIRTFTREGGVVTYNGTLNSGGYEKEPIKVLVFEGEKIYFENAATGSEDLIVTGPYDDDGDTKSGCKDYPRVEAGTPWDCSEDNYYFKVWEADNPDIGGWFGADDHSFSLELEKEEVREGEIFTLKMKKNNKMGGVMKLTIKDEDEFLITNVSGTYINKIPIKYDNETDFTGYDGHEDVGISFENGALVFDTTEFNMKEGEYTIILEDFATEVEKDEEIEVKKIFLDVELDDEVVKGDDIVIIITSSFYGGNVNVTVGDFYDKTFLPLDEDGKIMVTISTETEDAEYGKHKVTVEVCGTAEKVTKYVTVKEGKASLEKVPEDATVGDIISLKGSSDFGDFTVFLVDNVFKNEARISDDEFEWDWDTSGEHEGCHEIEVFILSEHAPFSIGENVSEDWQRGEGVDASAIICLLPPMLSMTVPEHAAAGDDVVINGEATGTDNVYIIVISENGDIVFPPGGIARATPVEGGEWEKNLDELELGIYAVISVHKGKDGTTAAIKEGEWAAGGEGMTMEQRVAILMGAVAGSDDLACLDYIDVELPYVKLNPVECIEIGEDLVVTGTTNRKEGYPIIITVKGPMMELPAKTAFVTEGEFNATFDTTDVLAGAYIIKADDGDGHTDTTTVEILPPEPPTPEVSIFTGKTVYSPGDVMKASIRISNPADDTQTLSFKWYLGIPEYELWTEMTAIPVNLPPGYDQTFTVSIPVGDWGTESFCGCHLVSLAETTTGEVVSMDSTVWTYTPGAVSTSKASAELVKEINETIGGIDKRIENV